MLPVILAGAALATLFFGCSSHNQEDAAQKPTSDPSQAPTSSASSTDPAPAPAQPLSIDKASLAFPVYQKLREAGLTEADLDQGYHEIDYSKPGPNETLLGKADGRVEEREVLETALDLFTRNPEDERYRRIVEGFAGKPIPWMLNDFDPSTEFDEQIRARVTAATASIQKLLASQKLLPDTEPYREKLAVALFYFTAFPDDLDFIQKNKSDLLAKTKELDDMGLGSFRKTLFERGGLGTQLMTEDSPGEATALEALQIKKGWCTEKSKILFGVFQAAKLDPFFVFNKAKDVASKTGVTVINQGGMVTRANHVYLGISLGAKNRFFDLAIFNSQADYPNFYPQRLIHYLSIDKTEHGTLLYEKTFRQIRSQGKSAETSKQLNEAGSILKEALLLQPQNYGALSGLASVLYTGGNTDQSNAILREAIRLEPESPTAHFNLGVNCLSQKKWALAEISFRETLQYDPSNLGAHKFLSVALVKQGNLDEAEVFLNKAARLAPQDEEVKEMLSFLQQKRARLNK